MEKSKKEKDKQTNIVSTIETFSNYRLNFTLITAQTHYDGALSFCNVPL